MKIYRQCEHFLFYGSSRFSGALTAFAVIMSGCSRSSQYVQEHQYYKSDSQYELQARESGADRAEKLGAPKKRILVLPFYNATPFLKNANETDELGAFLADELTREIKSAGRAIVPEDVRSADISRDFFSGDKVKVSALVREGRKLGVSLVVIGRIKKVSYRQKADEVGLLRKRRSSAAAEVEMRLFDVTEGKEVLLDQRSGDSNSSKFNLFHSDEESDSSDSREDLVKEALTSAAQRLGKDVSRALEKVSWEGRIAKITQQAIFVNAGRASGLALGDILKVTSQGDDVYDPVTGAYLGRSAGAVKGTLEIVDFLGPDGSITKIHSGAGFVENDVVQLY